MIRPVVLISILISGIYASAENAATPAPPTAEEVSTETVSPSGPSFFAPKTEDDIAHMATFEDDTENPADLSEE